MFNSTKNIQGYWCIDGSVLMQGCQFKTLLLSLLTLCNLLGISHIVLCKILFLDYYFYYFSKNAAFLSSAALPDGWWKPLRNLWINVFPNILANNHSSTSSTLIIYFCAFHKNHVVRIPNNANTSKVICIRLDSMAPSDQNIWDS